MLSNSALVSKVMSLNTFWSIFFFIRSNISSFRSYWWRRVIISFFLNVFQLIKTRMIAFITLKIMSHGFIHVLHLFSESIQSIFFLLIDFLPFWVFNFFSCFWNIIWNLLFRDIRLGWFNVGIYVYWRYSSVIWRSNTILVILFNIWKINFLIMDIDFICLLHWQISSLFLNTFNTWSNILWIILSLIFHVIRPYSRIRLRSSVSCVIDVFRLLFLVK